MLRRIGLFLLTNLAFIIMINLIVYMLGLFGIHISPNGYTGLLVWSVVWGLAGSFLSLRMSRRIAKRTHKMKMISENDTDPRHRVVYDMVAQIASEHHITTPEVWVYDSSQPNAFATGATKNSALVAVSTGLLELMDDDEVRAVVGHEMAHVLNGDMVSMTLLQGVLNTFVIFLSNTLSRVVAAAMDEEYSGLVRFGLHLLFNILLSMLASLVLMSYSRRREYYADAGAAQFMSTPTHMIAALRKLDTAFATHKYEATNDATSHLMIFGDIKGMFRSHPTTQQRIEALQNGSYQSNI